MRKYELMMIINPELSTEEMDSTLAMIRQELSDAAITIDSVEDMGVRDLAYKIQRSYTGRYFLFQLQTEEGTSFFEVTNLLNIQKDIWRFMFVRQDS